MHSICSGLTHNGGYSTTWTVSGDPLTITRWCVPEPNNEEFSMTVHLQSKRGFCWNDHSVPPFAHWLCEKEGEFANCL